jgi:putative nucleotidyltransferase with HDIG domain
VPTPGRARGLFAKAADGDRSGRLEEAIAGYEEAVVAAEAERDNTTLAEALRMLAVALHRRQERHRARALCERSRDLSIAMNDSLLEAQALNTLAVFDLVEGAMDSARVVFQAALDSKGADARLRARIEQNLGIMDNIQGDLTGALTHYRNALEAFQLAGDERGCAMAYDSLGMISADQKNWDAADAAFAQSIELTTRLGDVHLRAIGQLHRTEVFIARSQFDLALRSAEEALRVFDRLGVVRNKSDAYRVVGAVYRATGRVQLAEARLRMGIDLAGSVGAVLEEAEATREMALLYGEMGRNQDALRLLNGAYRLFGRLDARTDMVDVASRVDKLEGTYLAVVRDWGQSIESSDSYTHGHCERVASYAVAVAQALGFEEAELTTVRLGAYLHDLGKVKVPHEVLNKPGRLTEDEFELMKRHPADGVDMLADVDFPWDIKPMIRWHHEKYDGTGYPDGMRGDAIPVNAQVIAISDVFDALTTTRSYRPAMPWGEAFRIMRENSPSWRPDVFAAFLTAMEPMAAEHRSQEGVQAA